MSHGECVDGDAPPCKGKDRVVEKDYVRALPLDPRLDSSEPSIDLGRRRLGREITPLNDRIEPDLGETA